MSIPNALPETVIVMLQAPTMISAELEGCHLSYHRQIPDGYSRIGVGEYHTVQYSTAMSGAWTVFSDMRLGDTQFSETQFSEFLASELTIASWLLGSGL